MDGKKLMDAIGTAMAVVILVVIAALIIGTILASSVFTALTIVNSTLIAESFGDFVTNLIAFLAIIGTILGVVWLVFYVKALFDKQTGIQAMTA